jgi:hypothetical protein
MRPGNPLVASDDVIGQPRLRAIQKLGIGRIGGETAETSGRKNSPWQRNMASTAAISSGGRANFGRASTAAYS